MIEVAMTLDMRHYDKQGNPMSFERWMVLFEDHRYRRIAFTGFSNGVHVSTVWLGINHNWFNEGPPLIFETMAFNTPEDFEGIGQWRWSTEEQAIEGHSDVVAMVVQGMRDINKLTIVDDEGAFDYG